MKIEKRKEMVLAMERIVRSVNNEDFIERWLMLGVADGDIKSFDVHEVDENYIDDKTISEMMGLFLSIMNDARKDGGLYVDGIVSV